MAGRCFAETIAVQMGADGRALGGTPQGRYAQQIVVKEPVEPALRVDLSDCAEAWGALFAVPR